VWAFVYFLRAASLQLFWLHFEVLDVGHEHLYAEVFVEIVTF